MGIGLVVILPLLWKGILGQVTYVPGYSIQVNSSVRVQEGLCVTIPCNFTADNRNTFNNSFGYWRQTSGYIVATNDKSSDVQKTNFNLTGNPDTGDCTLTITGTRKEDEGMYFFRFEESKESKVKYNYPREITTNIIVTDLTEEPVIWDVGTLTAGIDKTVTCAPPGKCSVTSLVIQWKKSDVSGIWKNSSTITFTPSPDDHQKNITCEVTNSRGRTTRRTIVLDVCSPVALTITRWIDGKNKKRLDSFKVTEGSSVTLGCSVQSNLTLNVTWTDEKNNVLQRGTGKDLELRLENMTMNQTGTYTCSALTEHVINSTNVNITVQYPPRNMEIIMHTSKGEERPASPQVAVNQTEKLTLVCSAEGNPPVTVVWVRGEDDVDTSIMSNNGLSAVINVTSSEADVYRCLAWNGLGLRERRVQVGTKKEYFNGDIGIGFLCGMIITIVIVLLYIVSMRKKMHKTKTHVSEKEQPASEESTTDSINLTSSRTDQHAEENAANIIQVDSSNVTLDREDVLYATVNFNAKTSKVPTSQPETEYAEIKRK